MSFFHSWITVLIETFLVFSAFYHSLRFTRWWNVVNKGVSTATSPRHVPSVNEYYGLENKRSALKKSSRSVENKKSYEETHAKAQSPYDRHFYGDHEISPIAQ
ncbi:unnamed protein product [Caenorhabditis auriculariae]|uniref:Uncharacterized protein n=1 Tax=Caenorhabditis auriculariae TaxID=2777116 RepID=A0A8S1HPN1_9PELO|nr:unnamed protein product [Caenorhabditis auriculariae]